MDDYEDSSPSNSSSESSSKPAEKKNDSAHQTALLPKSFFPENSVGVGKECKIKQVAIHEDEVEVRYMAHTAGDSKGKMRESDMPMRQSMMDDDYA